MNTITVKSMLIASVLATSVIVIPVFADTARDKYAMGNHEIRVGSTNLEIDRTVELEAYDTMRYSIDDLFVQSGETIRFVVTNKGRLPHEFSIGTIEEQQRHVKRMAISKHHDEQQEANTLTLRPGETKQMIWHVDDPKGVEIACLIPSHYQAGMILPLKTP